MEAKVNTEAVARAKEGYELFYDFSAGAYLVAKDEQFINDPLPLGSEGYPKCPSGRWVWLPGQWQKIKGMPAPAAPAEAPKTSEAPPPPPPAGGKKSLPKVIQQARCIFCKKVLLGLDHYHSRRGERGAAEVFCCPCALAQGYPCDIAEKEKEALT